MPTRYYRALVVWCALSWFMVGLHLPALHELTHDDHAPPLLVLAVTALFAIGAVAGLWLLLRAPAWRAAPPGRDASAP